VTRRGALPYLIVTTVLCLAAIVAVLIPAPRPVQIAAVLASTAASIVTLLRAEHAIARTCGDSDR
jgi:hypothetical protein